MQLTAAFIAVPEGYLAFVEELPGANTQGTRWKRPARTFGKQSLWFWKQTAS
jgi:hypothetical protein